MKDKMFNETLTTLNESMIEGMEMVESLIKSTLEMCLTKECVGEYYDLENYTKRVSEERNHYINILSIALERLKSLERVNNEIEKMIIDRTYKKLGRVEIEK